MKPFLHITAFWGAVLVGAWIYASSDIEQPAGVLAADEPQQEFIVPRTWDRGDAHFTAVARFDLKARVLSANHYQFDAGAVLSPVDLALGWGPMSDSENLDHLTIRQSGRFYFWRPRFGHKMPIPKPEVISHSANMHMIPADEGVRKTLQDVRAGEIVKLSGFLVDIRRPRGWTWKTSLSRTDTGMGACEVVWVEHLSHWR